MKLTSLSIKDRIALKSWLLTRLSLADVESFSRSGVVENERFTDRAREIYFVLWTWSAERFHGEPGRLQDAFEERFGHARLLQRIERCKRFINRLIEA